MPEALIAALDELEIAWQKAMVDPTFLQEFEGLLQNYAGVPSMLYDAHRLSEHAGARILLKREDLNHTGAHKIRNVLGQALLTKRMGKTRVIAETGAGQHGVASATAAAYLGLDCTVYMGEVDTERQALNVARMQLLGAEVIPVKSGSRTLKDAINEALRDWVASVDHTAYLFGTAAGPHPFPSLVLSFVRGIGDEARRQCLDLTGRLPDAITACVGGGSNAIGLFAGFLDDPEVAIYGFEAGGDGVETGRHAATIFAGSVGVLHGSRTYVLQDDDGQTVESHSISAGLDYPGVGPQHAALAASGRASYLPVTDAEAMDAMALLARTEGIIPAIESAHAIAGTLQVAKERQGQTLLVNLSGRGDKDMGTALDYFGLGNAGPSPVSEEARGGVSTSVSVAYEKARADGRAALVGYLPAGFPTVDGGIAALRTMVEAGCDVIEIGLPYSDPVMDGPTIQAAAQQALDAGVRTSDVLRTVEAVAATGIPTLVMTYWNPIERYGVERFAQRPVRRRRRRPDHAGPDARLRARVDRGRRRPGPGQGVPRRTVLDRRADRDDHGCLPGLRLRHRRHGRHRRPRLDQ